jgi:3-oxoadipate enol-lactonase
MRKTFISYFIISILLISFSSCKDINTACVTGFAEVNCTSLYYEVAGKGEPIVFVHGNFGDRRHWDYQFEPLSKSYKVVRYDVRGYGKSALPKPDETYYDTGDLKALLEYLGIKKAHICGVSMGSGIIIDFALEYPDMCLSIIPTGPWAVGFGENEYISPAADSLFNVMAKTTTIAKEQGSKEATDFFWTGNIVMAPTANKSKSTLDSLLKMGYDYSYWGFLNQSKRSYTTPPAIGRLKEIKIPALIITAEYDADACKEIAEIMDNDIQNSVRVSIKGAGHLMNMDKPEEFNRYLTEFFDTLK